ncbi:MULTISPECIES: hypothetical protein [Sphingobacterium]|uniref:hypothetical protein n=1 Tax=Sphingobacterium TaxID=28453 RepID=UPI0013DABE5C|nr:MULTISPECIES: hypothetical protein [unclassified Sphingobacterium]
MKTICIKHPLRDLIYTTNEIGTPLSHEVQSLDNYRKAHDEVWKMKLLFEKERGKVLLAIIEIDLLDREYLELLDMYNFYKETSQLSPSAPLYNLDYKLQVELRDFYLQVKELHQAILRFYDEVRSCTTAYNAITDTFYRGDKPIDPLNFTVLDAIFLHHEDMDVDIVSLDKDLQEFLQTVTEVYNTMDDYIVQYNELYQIYSRAIFNIAQLSKDVYNFQML